LKALPPKITFKIENYHHTVEIRRGEPHYKKVITSTYSQLFRFREWGDLSPSSTIVDYIRNFRLTRLDIGMEVEKYPPA